MHLSCPVSTANKSLALWLLLSQRNVDLLVGQRTRNANSCFLAKSETSAVDFLSWKNNSMFGTFSNGRRGLNGFSFKSYRKDKGKKDSVAALLFLFFPLQAFRMDSLFRGAGYLRTLTPHWIFGFQTCQFVLGQDISEIRYIWTWYLKHPLQKACFSWMTPKSLHEKRVFQLTIFPSIKNGTRLSGGSGWKNGFQRRHSRWIVESRIFRSFPGAHGQNSGPSWKDCVGEKVRSECLEKNWSVPNFLRIFSGLKPMKHRF